LLNLERGNIRAFQSGNSNQIKDLRAELLSWQGHRSRITNQLKARIADEHPELAKFKPTDREWGSKSPKCWETLLEVEGLSWLSREDIRQVIYWNDREQSVELELSRLIAEPDFERYRPVWDR